MAVSVRSGPNTSVTIQPAAANQAVSVVAPNGSSLSVNQGGSSPSNLVIRKSTGGTLTSLGDVNTASLQDGYTLIYDSETNKWISQSVTSSVISVDGGRY